MNTLEALFTLAVIVTVGQFAWLEIGWYFENRQRRRK